MSIASRITAITGHITDIYDTMALGGDTTQNKNIVNINTEIKREYKDFLANGTDELWNKWEKVVGEGTQLSLTPTIKGKMKVDLKGNTYQKTTTGKNLIPTQVDKWEQGTFDAITGIPTSSTTRIRPIDYYPISNDTNYYMSIQNSNYCFINIMLYDSNKQFVEQYFNIDMSINGAINKQINIPSSKAPNVAYMRVIIRNQDNNSTITANEITTIKPQIELGTSKTTWEEYTGGIPSPNPDYPQDIQVVSGDNTIKVEGKNLFDKDNANVIIGYINGSGVISSSNDNRTIWLPIKQNTDYAIKMTTVGITTSTSGDDVKIGLTKTQPTIGDQTNLIYTKSTVAGVNYTHEKTFNSGEYNYVVIKIGNTSRINYGESIATLQICIGNVIPTTYTPYVSQSYPISLGNIELCKIGTYQDSIVKDNGKWYLNKQIGKVVLDGSENWNVGTRSDNTTKFFYRSYNEILTNNTSVGNEYSNYFKIENPYTSLNDSVWLFKQGNMTSLRLGFSNQDIITEAGLQSWLSTHNTNLYFPLATPTNEEITDTTLLSQLNALAYSYEGTTNISQVNDDLAFVLDITALKEMS